MLQRPILAALLLAVVAAGCTTTKDPESLAQNDPYEPTNRAIFKFNTAIDNNFAKPVAKFYNHAVPEPARDGLHNILANLNKPVVLGNDVLQGECTMAGQTLARLTVNSTLGLGGILDVATHFGIPDHDNDFGLTLGKWGVGEGPYFVAPFVGPAPPRDLGGKVVDIFMDPLTYARFHGSDTWSAVRGGLGALDDRARNIDTVEQIERTSIDFYATSRSLYRQYRDSEIRDGKPAPDADFNTPSTTTSP
jgi:phospholipid-binding lipoprotein MlaA